MKISAYVISEAAPCFVEDACIHEFQIRRNFRLEVHICKNIFLEVNARSNFNNSNFMVNKLEYSTLCNIQNCLILAGVLTSKSDLLNLVYELLCLALFNNLELAVAGFELTFGVA